MQKFIVQSAIVFLLFVRLLPTAAGQQTVLEPEGHEVTLTGTLVLAHGYGPPGYGEDKKHDRKMTYWALKLPHKINTPCVPEKPEWANVECEATNQPRLFFPDPSPGKDLNQEAWKLRGHKVTVTGTLSRSSFAIEMTPINMNATDLAQASK